ncbi:hypothetical protein [Streptomyces flavofungini]|uniref:hypothetical protein n=1 Tax=Streptomyces flavofungini TaxID=68200 RepID=UPI003F5408A9
MAMVDGFATAGPRHVRAARKRQEARIGSLVRAERERAPVSATAQDHPDGTPTALSVVARHRDADGTLLDPHSQIIGQGQQESGAEGRRQTVLPHDGPRLPSSPSPEFARSTRAGGN